MPDFLDEMHQEISSRLDELRPLVEEHRRLEAATAALARVDGLARPTVERVSSPRSRRGSGRPRRASRVGSPKPAAGPADKAPAVARRRGGRPKGSGPRGAAEALSLIQAQPGITMSELAVNMGTKPNYLYRVLLGLSKAGEVVKKGKGWHPKA